MINNSDKMKFKLELVEDRLGFSVIIKDSASSLETELIRTGSYALANGTFSHAVDKINQSGMYNLLGVIHGPRRSVLMTFEFKVLPIWSFPTNEK